MPFSPWMLFPFVLCYWGVIEGHGSNFNPWDAIEEDNCIAEWMFNLQQN
jgi:hypothetical protein